jgi:hypothetical protein
MPIREMLAAADRAPYALERTHFAQCSPANVKPAKHNRGIAYGNAPIEVAAW